MKKRREIETKFILKNIQEIESVTSRLYFYKFTELEPCRQLDYSLDTVDWRCRTNNIILRFRQISTLNSPPSIILTLKRSRINTKYRDYEETETKLGNPDKDTQKYIQHTLHQTIGLKLPTTVFSLSNFSDVISTVRASGFTQHRMLIEKHRKEYVLQDRGVHVTIDTFPDGMGSYLEIEAFQQLVLDEYIHKLHLNELEPEPLDYGELLKKLKQSLPEIQRRTAVFDESILELVLRA